MKLTLSLAVLCTLLLTVMSFPRPEDSHAVNMETMKRFPRQAPQAPPRGSVGANVDYSRGGGVVGSVNGQATLWRSRNGMSDLGANGQYSRVFTGPGRGQQSYGGGVVFTHRF